MDEVAIIALLAFGLDLILGDPEYKYHPIRLIGNLISFIDKKINNNRKISGLMLVITVTFIAYTSAYLLSELSILFAIFIFYSSLAVKDLKLKTNEIEKLLKDGNIPEARKSLSMIVGRDTDNLDRNNIIRATVETIGENTVDGIIAPLFWGFIGGAPLILLYKAINTMDSMVGYKNKRYANFGYFAAKLDDIVNYLPARITYLLIPVIAIFYNGTPLKTFNIGLKYGRKNPSPNAGIPEALFAGILNIKLGGDNYYFGKLSRKEKIGEGRELLEISDITEANKIALYTGVLMLLCGVIIRNLI